MLLQYLFDIVFVLDLQLRVSITTKVLSSNPVHGEVCDDDKIKDQIGHFLPICNGGIGRILLLLMFGGKFTTIN